MMMAAWRELYARCSGGLQAGAVAGDSPAQPADQVHSAVPGEILWQNFNDPADGVHFEGTLTFDWSSNLRGGVNTNGSAFRHLLDISLTLDAETLLGLQGGTVGMLFQNQNGPDASIEDTGDLQVFSNIDADGRTQLADHLLACGLTE